MNYDPRKLIEALEKATGISDADSIKKKLKQHNEDDLVSALESNDYNLSGHRNFLRKYLEELKNHRENAKLVKNVKKNYSEIEDLYTELETEVSKIEEGTAELEKIANALDDKELLKKLERRDESKAKRLNEKLKHLISMKEKMEELEARLESETEHFDDLEHALERRIKLVEKLRDEDNNGSGSPNTSHMVVSLSDVHGHKNRMDKALSLLSKSSSYPALGDGDYTLVLNGDAFDDRTGTEGKSKEVFLSFKNWANSSDTDIVYTFGNHDQFIMFKEFWCAIGQQHSNGGYDDPFFLEISESNRKWFLNEVLNGCVVGQWKGDHDYRYAHAAPQSNLNKVLEESAEKILKLLNGKDPFSIISKSEVTNTLQDIDSKFGLERSKSGNGMRDLDVASPNDLEAIIAIQYRFQYNKKPAVFHHKNGALWVRWDDLTSTTPGKYIVGHTMSPDCSSGTSFFKDGTNPRFHNGGDLINENTIRQDETALLIEKPGGDVCALREESGSIEEMCLSDH